MMERQLTQLVRIVDDLLDVSRISRGKMELRKEPVELAAVVQSAVETSRPVIEERGHDLTVALPPESVTLDADLTRLAQVFANLLNNSAKYTPAGGRIRLAAERRGREVVVSVEDTGIGIPEGSLGSIFDMFSQVDRTLERTTGGLGIGLSLVKGLVEMHGGTVEVTSGGEGMGSTFTVRLPVSTAGPPVERQAGRNGEAVAAPRRRVLVVDDNRDSAESLAMLLRLTGNEVRTAHDGHEAVDAAGAYRPDLILMDVGMPKLNGLDATRRIRQQPWGKGVVIVALTGWGQEDDRQRTTEAGCDGHLVKPVEPDALEKLLAGLASGTA
jgi:CheY-like chemotaxis protein